MLARWQSRSRHGGVQRDLFRSWGACPQVHLSALRPRIQQPGSDTVPVAAYPAAEGLAGLETLGQAPVAAWYRRGHAGQARHGPSFTSDALRHYTPVLLEVFGTWQRPTPTGMPGRPCNPIRVPHPLLGYAQVEKHRQGSRVMDVNRSVIFGAPDDVLARDQGLRRSNGRKGTINTAYVERHNLTLKRVTIHQHVCAICSV